MKHWRLTVVWMGASLIAVGCDSGTSDPVEPANPGPHLYIHAGVGMAGNGEMGNLPRKTELYTPQDIVFAPDGEPVIIDWNNHRVIKVNATSGDFERLFGAENDFGDPCPPAPTPCDDITAASSRLNHPTDIAYDHDGNIVLCAWHNSELFLLNPQSGLMSRICGDGSRDYNGDGQPALTALVDLPVSVVIDPQWRVVFCDQANMIVRRINDDGTIETIVGTPPVLVNGSLQYQFGFSGNDGPATAAKLNLDRGQVAAPSGRICYDNAGNLYVTDSKNHCVRVVDTNGIIHQFAGVGGEAGYSGDGGPATSAHLRQPRDVAADADGNVFIADTDNHVIRRVSPDGKISTVAGRVRPVTADPPMPDVILAEDGKTARECYLTFPFGVAIDPAGRLWIADSDNHVIRILDE